MGIMSSQKPQLHNTHTQTLAGVFVDVFDTGVFITGASGVGKSELALGLIASARGHKLVADDAVIFSRMQNDPVIIGTCPSALQNFLEIRGLGILDIRALFGEAAIQANKPLQLIIHLMATTLEELQQCDRLHGTQQHQQLLGLSIPEITLPVFPGRSLAVLTECAVKDQLLKQSGYFASQTFCEHHNQHTAITS